MNKQIVSIAFACAVALVFAGSASTSNPMTVKENSAKNDAAIRELIDGFVKAIRAKDINGVMSVFAPEVVSFDLGPAHFLENTCRTPTPHAVSPLPSHRQFASLLRSTVPMRIHARPEKCDHRQRESQPTQL